MHQSSSPTNNSVFISGPSFNVDLAPLDARHPIHYSRRLLFFRCSSSAQSDAQLAALRAGLQALVLKCPILGGTIVPLSPDVATDGQEDWRTIVPGQGIELVVRDLRKSMPPFETLELGDFAPIKLPYDLLVPIPRDLGNDRPFAACKVQFSIIEGGTIFTFSMSHSVADGSGTNELMRILSSEIRVAEDHAKAVAVDDSGTCSRDLTTGVSQNRSLLRSISSEIEFNIEDHPAFGWKPDTSPSDSPFDEPPSHPFEATTLEVPVLIKISAASLAQLKIDATLPGAPSISTHDAISALIWRSALLVRSQRTPSGREFPTTASVNLFMPSDARSHLGLPPSYVGNAVYQLSAMLEFGKLVSPSGLQHAATAIRRAIKAVNSDLVSSYMTAIKTRWVDWQFLSTMTTTGVAMGTDWSSGPLYSDDWGKAFGRVARFRYPGDAFTCVLPKLPDGGAELMVAVMPSEVEMLLGDDCFGRYIETR